MLDKRLSELFALLSEEEYKTAESFSEKLDLSSKTIRTLLKNLDEVLMENGAHILSKHGYGYKLVIEDLERIKQLKAVNQNIYLPKTSEERIQYCLEYLLNSKEYVKCEDLSEMLFVSKKTLAQDLKEVERLMKKYNLTIDRKPYHGIKAVGREFDLRLCIAEYTERKIKFNFSYDKELNAELKEIAEMISEAINYKNYKMSDVAFQNLIVHIHIAIKRIQENRYIPLDYSELSDLIGDVEIQIAKECAARISKRFFVSFPKSEVEYIAVHLAGKKMLDLLKEGKDNLVIGQEINDVVKEMLQVVYEAFKFDFRNDLELIMSLGQHLIPLEVRMKFDMKMKNPLLKDIKERFSLAYAMAAQACIVITERYQKDLEDDEIGYIALTIALALERQRTSVVKKNILLVCSSGKGSAQLLSYKLKEAFLECIDTIQICDVRSINKFNFKDIDYVFTTVPILAKVPVPIQEIQYFLESKDIKAMEKLFHSDKRRSSIAEYYNEALFMVDVTLLSKEEILKHMCTHIKKYKDIPDEFYNAVLKRERLAKTEFGNLVAMPHPNITLTNETFVCVCILKKPIQWDKQMVQVIFLVSIENRRNKQLQPFYRITSKLLSNKQYINELIKKKDFQVLQNLLQKIEEDMEDENNG